MSGWIKVDKSLIDTIKFRRVVRAVSKGNALRGVTDVSDSLYVTTVLGALVRLWIYADTHIGNDDTLAITLDEINDLVGVDGFAQALPAEWLQVIDSDHVQLPDFLSHNGSSEKLRRDNARRQAAYRHRHDSRNVTRDVTVSNARNDARPDQTRPDKTRVEKIPTASSTPAWFTEFKLAYPKRAGDQGWRKAEKAANARLSEGHVPRELIDGAIRYATYCVATGKIGTEYVKQAATFLGPDKPFLQPWDLPATKADTRLAGNISAAEEFMRRTEVQ
jgi:hypothetical protein